MKPCGLLGEKLGHSFSPLIHSRFGNYEYRLFPTPQSELQAFLKSGSFSNLNVTIPYKKSVIQYCSQISPLAQQIGSVNTIKAASDGLHGYNTDYFGFKSMLEKANIPINGEKCAVIGNGGVSATICAVLKNSGAKKISIITRDKNNPQYIKSISDHTIVINATPVGMYPNNGQSPLDLRLFDSLKGVADVIYNPLKTALILQAEEMGIPCIGGLIMLVAQAKQAAEIFEDKTISDEQMDKVFAEIQRKCENIILIGMPGSGKTSIGKQLAERLSKPFYDTDALIEKSANKTIPQIFEQDGEDYFRNIETKILAETTAKSGCIISTGGGIIKHKINIPLLRQNGKIIFVDRPLKLLATDGRPLSSSAEALEKLYSERYPIYRHLSDAIVINDATLSDAVAKTLALI